MGGIEHLRIISCIRGIVVCALCLSLILSAEILASKAFAAEAKSADKSAANAEFDRVSSELEELVGDFFPRAKFEKTSQTIHFEFKAKKSAAGPGSNRLILAPKVDGIVGDIKLRSGKYKTDKVLPYRVNEMYWVSLLMAPYSELDNSHLYSRILFPPQTPIAFVNSLKDIVGSYEKESTKESKSESENEDKTKSDSLSAAVEKDVIEDEAMVVSIVSDGESVKVEEAPENKEKTTEEEAPKVDFGAPKFSSYSFSEGRFKIKLPGSPDVSAANRAGMRFVDYKYLESQGLYNIGYAILPGSIRSEREDEFLNTISQALIKAARGKVAKHHSLKWQGYPGRQIAIESLGGKENRSSLLRIILVKEYFYMLQAAGTTPWVNSDAVKTVLNSLEVRPTLSSRQKYELRRRETERDMERRRYEYEAEQRNRRPRYNHTLEKIRADRKYNRRRY